MLGGSNVLTLAVEYTMLTTTHVPPHGKDPQKRLYAITNNGSTSILLICSKDNTNTSRGSCLMEEQGELQGNKQEEEQLYLVQEEVEVPHLVWEEVEEPYLIREDEKEQRMDLVLYLKHGVSKS